MPDAIPEWAKDTKEDCDYQLVMWQPDGDAVESVWIERAEFIQLKRTLACIRGYYPDTQTAAKVLKDEG